jgi:hypothetical protein
MFEAVAKYLAAQEEKGSDDALLMGELRKYYQVKAKVSEAIFGASLSSVLARLIDCFLACMPSFLAPA